MYISGTISQLFKGLDRDKTPIESFIGLPITDQDGNPIGVITAVDIDNGIWHGELSCDIFKKEKEVSMEMDTAVKHKEELSNIPSSITQSGIPANAIRECFGFEPIDNYAKET